jgi:hypothetical protein
MRRLTWVMVVSVIVMGGAWPGSAQAQSNTNVLDGWGAWTRSVNNCTTGWKDPMNGFGNARTTSSMNAEFYYPMRDYTPFDAMCGGSQQNLTRGGDCNTNSVMLADYAGCDYSNGSTGYRSHIRYRQASSYYPAIPAHMDYNPGSGDGAYSFNQGRENAAWEWVNHVGRSYSTSYNSYTTGCTYQSTLGYSTCGDGYIARYSPF